MAETDAQIIERFHIAFLRALDGRLDRTLYVLKGGANLRYFFESVRYSEDIDLDISEIEVWRLQDKMSAVLDSSGPLAKTLASGGLWIESYSTPKQTETTQRWKVCLNVSGRHNPVRTKIEFSRRNGETRYIVERIPARLVDPYGLRAPMVQHYEVDAATKQKVEALADRSETQTRDIFDLELLMRQHKASLDGIQPNLRERAAEMALSLPYSAFRDQVLPFLEPEDADLYQREEDWEEMYEYVAQRLLGERP